MTTLTRLDCGELHGDLGMFETGAEGQVTLPASGSAETEESERNCGNRPVFGGLAGTIRLILSTSAWLVRHPRGTVLFDTGMPASFVEGTDRTQRISEFLTIGFSTNDTVEVQLEANSQDPGRVDFVVISHLHFDHVGGLSMVPNATLVIQRKEWEAGIAVAHDADTLHARKDYDLGHTLRLVDGEYDLFGDDAVVCIPTPGHTVGHQSLRVRLLTGQQVVLAADCCYFARTLDGGTLPTFGHDLDEQRRSLAHLLKLRNTGATIIPGHDINVVRSMPRTLGANRGT